MTKDLVTNSEMIMMDSDILFDKRILERLIKSEYSNCLALRTDHKLSDEEIKVRLNEDNSIAEISKTCRFKFGSWRINWYRKVQCRIQQRII